MCCNSNQTDHVNVPPPQPHLNYYPTNRENMITNQQSTQLNQFTQQMSRRRSFCMNDNNCDGVSHSKRQHIDDYDNRLISQCNENKTQCRNGYGESNNCAVSSTTAPNSNSVAQVQSTIQTVSAPQVTSVVIGEDVINIYRLYEEHNLLRRRVEINEERLQELRATNTYLLQQNEQLRRQTACNCTSTIVNPVTLTTASQPSAGAVIIIKFKI